MDAHAGGGLCGVACCASTPRQPPASPARYPITSATAAVAGTLPVIGPLVSVYDPGAFALTRVGVPRASSRSRLVTEKGHDVKNRRRPARRSSPPHLRIVSCFSPGTYAERSIRRHLETRQHRDQERQRRSGAAG